MYMLSVIIDHTVLYNSSMRSGRSQKLLLLIKKKKKNLTEF